MEESGDGIERVMGPTIPVSALAAKLVRKNSAVGSHVQDGPNGLRGQLAVQAVKGVPLPEPEIAWMDKWAILVAKETLWNQECAMSRYAHSSQYGQHGQVAVYHAALVLEYIPEHA